MRCDISPNLKHIINLIILLVSMKIEPLTCLVWRGFDGDLQLTYIPNKIIRKSVKVYPKYYEKRKRTQISC